MDTGCTVKISTLAVKGDGEPGQNLFFCSSTNKNIIKNHMKTKCQKVKIFTKINFIKWLSSIVSKINDLIYCLNYKHGHIIFNSVMYL